MLNRGSTLSLAAKSCSSLTCVELYVILPYDQESPENVLLYNAAPLVAPAPNVGTCIRMWIRVWVRGEGQHDPPKFTPFSPVTMHPDGYGQKCGYG